MSTLGFRFPPPQHCMDYGVMIAFKFGSIVYCQSKPAATVQGSTRVPLPAVRGDGSSGLDEGGGGAHHAAGSRSSERAAAAAAAQLQQELTRAVRTAVTDPVLTKARMEGEGVPAILHDPICRMRITCLTKLIIFLPSEAHVVVRPGMRRLPLYLAPPPLLLCRGARCGEAGHAAPVCQGAGPCGGPGAGPG